MINYSILTLKSSIVVWQKLYHASQYLKNLFLFVVFALISNCILDSKPFYRSHRLQTATRRSCSSRKVMWQTTISFRQIHYSSHKSRHKKFLVVKRACWTECWTEWAFRKTHNKLFRFFSKYSLSRSWINLSKTFDNKGNTLAGL